SPLTTHLFLEQHHAGREAVDEVLAADRSKLTLGKETRHRHAARLAANGPRVVVLFLKEASPPAVAGEQQGAGRLSRMRAQVLLQKCTQVLVGGFGVADVELDC